MGTRVTVLVLSSVVVTCSSTSSQPEAGVDSTEEVEKQDDRCPEPRTQFLPQQDAPEHLLVVDTTQMDRADLLLLTSLQGNVNRTKPRIYAINGPNDGQGLWLDDYERMYGITHEEAPPLLELVAQFGSEVNGVIVNDPDFFESISLATTLAGIHGALVVEPRHLEEPTIAALPVVEDLRGKWTDATAMYGWMLQELWPQANQQTIAAQSPETLDGWLGKGGADLRDYLIANRIFTFYRSPQGDEREMLETIMDAIPDDLPVLGYLSIDGAEEIAAQTVLNERNKWLIPTHNSQNLSVHSGVPADIESLSRLAANPRPGPPLSREDIESHLIVTAALTDYDNYQVPLESGRIFWDHPARGTVPLSWGIPGTALTLAPGMVEYYYQTRSPNDSFVLPTSLGYFTPSVYRNLDWIAAETTKTMCALGLDVMYPLDSINGLTAFSQVYRDSLVPFTKDFEMRGFFLNYFPTEERCCVTGPAEVPFCYTATGYGDQQGAIGRRIEEALALRREGEPSFLFLGLNGWRYGPEQVLREYEALDPAAAAHVKWVTQEQFFEAIRTTYQDSVQGCSAPQPLDSTCPATEVPCAADDDIERNLTGTSVVLDPLAGVFECPKGLGTILGALLPRGSIPPLLFGFQEQDGHELKVVGAFAVDGNPPWEQNLAQPSLSIPEPADFSCNPYVVLEVAQLVAEVSGFSFNINNLRITGKLDSAGNLSEGTLAGVIDPGPFKEQFGINPCDLGDRVCNRAGLIELMITGLTGQGSEVAVVEVTES
jgi:hypothetical protein